MTNDKWLGVATLLSSETSRGKPRGKLKDSSTHRKLAKKSRQTANLTSKVKRFRIFDFRRFSEIFDKSETIRQMAFYHFSLFALFISNFGPTLDGALLINSWENVYRTGDLTRFPLYVLLEFQTLFDGRKKQHNLCLLNFVVILFHESFTLTKTWIATYCARLRESVFRIIFFYFC